MKFVAENTDVPVPNVHLVFEYKSRIFIVMECIHGRYLAYDWRERSPESRAAIFAQLRSIVQSLRNLRNPKGQEVVSNIIGGPIFDPRLPKTSHWGPFPSIFDVRRELRNGILLQHLNEDDRISDLSQLIELHEKQPNSTVFTHGDLSSINILARGDDVVGIVDWETAAWMPPYWEYTSAWDANPQNRFWQKEVDKFLEPYPECLQMEIIRKKYFDDF